MKKGDILLVHSKLDPLAWLIRLVTKSEWNHVAWAIDTYHLIEARSMAIAECPITKYLNWRYKVKLIRLKRVTKDQYKEAIEFVKQFKGKRTYIRYLKTILRILFMGDEARRDIFTCSGLIARGLEEADYYFISPHVKDTYFITPEDISNARYNNVSYELKKVWLKP